MDVKSHQTSRSLISYNQLKRQQLPLRYWNPAKCLKNLEPPNKNQGSIRKNRVKKKNKGIITASHRRQSFIWRVLCRMGWQPSPAERQTTPSPAFQHQHQHETQRDTPSSRLSNGALDPSDQDSAARVIELQASLDKQVCPRPQWTGGHRVGGDIGLGD